MITFLTLNSQLPILNSQFPTLNSQLSSPAQIAFSFCRNQPFFYLGIAQPVFSS